MAEAALFIGRGEPARGRETLANRDICGPHYDRAADISAELRLFLVGIIAEVLKRDVDEPIRDSSERVIDAEDLADVSRRPFV